MGSKKRKKDLQDQLDGLFDQVAPEPETEAGIEPEETVKPPELEDVATDLLRTEASAWAAKAESVTAETDVGMLFAEELTEVKPAAPEPVEPEPIAPKPPEPEPITVKPPEPEPAVAEPVVAEPAAPEPVVEKPVEPKLAAVKPVEPKLVAARPGGPEPVIVKRGEPKQVAVKPAEPEPVVEKPVEPEPVAVKPVEPEPVAVKPVEPEPIAVEPVEPEPIAVEPAEPEPVAVEPVEPEPVAVEPVEPELVAVEPAEPEPVAIEPVEPEPVAVEPAEPEPVAVEPVEPEPVAVEPVEPEPIAVEPVKPKPVPVEPAEPEPIAVKLVVAEPVTAEPIGPQPAVVEPFVPRPAEAVPTEEAAPPTTTDWEASLQQQRLKILNAMLASLSVLGFVLVVITAVQVAKGQTPLARSIPYFLAFAVLAIVTVARRLSPTIRISVLVALGYGVGALLLYNGGPQGMGDLYLMVAPLLFAILVRQRTGVISAIASIAIYTIVIIAHHFGLLPVGTTDFSQWTSVADVGVTFAMLVLGTVLIQWMFNSYLTGVLQQTTHSQELLGKRAGELAATNTLLERRTRQLQTAAQISQTAAAMLDPDELMQQAVGLIQHRLVLYHVSLFLLDESGEQAILKASTGEVGHQMLAQGYSVEVGGTSAVGWCAAAGQANIALDITEEAIRLDDLLLPKTRSNAALPLRSRSRMIGVLNVQSTMPDAFFKEDIAVLQTIADQLAVTIDNTRLFAETRARVKELEAIQRAYVREQWSKFARTQERPLYERTQPNVPSLSDAALPPELDLQRAIEQAMTQQEVVTRSDGGDGGGETAVVAPLRLRGEVIGVLGLQNAEGGRQWTDDEIALVKAVTDQMALAIENARLLEETQRRAEQRQLLADISAQVRASTQVDTILRTAIRELGRALRASDGLIRLEVGDAAGSLQARERAVDDDDNG